MTYISPILCAFKSLNIFCITNMKRFFNASRKKKNRKIHRDYYKLFANRFIHLFIRSFAHIIIIIIEFSISLSPYDECQWNGNFDFFWHFAKTQNISGILSYFLSFKLIGEVSIISLSIHSSFREICLGHFCFSFFIFGWRSVYVHDF